MIRKKTKEQLLEELIQMQKFIEQKVEAQDLFIVKFKTLIKNEGLFTQIIENLPYPMAIFDRSGVLIMANKALLKAANLTISKISGSKLNFLNRITNENYTVLEAAEEVFFGETTVLKDQDHLISLFVETDENLITDNYRSAVFFPVIESNGHIHHGALMLMK